MAAVGVTPADGRAVAATPVEGEGASLPVSGMAVEVGLGEASAGVAVASTPVGVPVNVGAPIVVGAGVSVGAGVKVGGGVTVAPDGIVTTAFGVLLGGGTGVSSGGGAGVFVAGAGVAGARVGVRHGTVPTHGVDCSAAFMACAAGRAAATMRTIAPPTISIHLISCLIIALQCLRSAITDRRISLLERQR